MWEELTIYWVATIWPYHRRCGTWCETLLIGGVAVDSTLLVSTGTWDSEQQTSEVFLWWRYCWFHEYKLGSIVQRSTPSSNRISLNCHYLINLLSMTNKYLDIYSYSFTNENEQNKLFISIYICIVNFSLDFYWPWVLKMSNTHSWIRFSLKRWLLKILKFALTILVDLWNSYILNLSFEVISSRLFKRNSWFLLQRLIYKCCDVQYGEK